MAAIDSHGLLDTLRGMDLGTVKAAALGIDLHRGHLDLSVATMPVRSESDAKRIVAANARFFGWCRSRGIPVVHAMTKYRDADEIRANPFWRTRADDPRATRKNVLRHNLAGMAGCTIVPELLDAERDWVVDTKKRYDCFVGTDLDFLLRSHGIDALLLTGINTNSCVLATAVSANVKDYAVIVVEDCVDTMDPPELHAAALACIRTAFGFVLSSDEVKRLPGLAAR